MSQNATIKIFRAIVGVVVVFTVLVAYNNCGQSSFAPAPYHNTNEKLVGEFAKLYSGVLSADVCGDPEKYQCSHWIFSEDVEDSQADVDYPCVAIGGREFCVFGKQTRFNTKAAKMACGETADCANTYEYEEFKCALMLPDAAGNFPIRGESPDFPDALEIAFQTCMRVVNGGVER